MSDGFICKDCNYTSDQAGNCPHCDMPLESIDVDEVTGEVEQYDPNEIQEVEKETKNDPEFEPDPKKSRKVIEEDELDELIGTGEIQNDKKGDNNNDDKEEEKEKK